MKASALRRDLLKECGGRVPRGLSALRKTQTFQELSAAAGVDVRGRALKGGAKPQVFLESQCDGIGHGDCFSIRDLFANLCFFKGTSDPVGLQFIMEELSGMNSDLFEDGGAMGAVDSTVFMGITGQLLFSSLLKGYQQEEFVITKQIPTKPTPFEAEKIPGVTPPKDPGKNVLRVAEGEQFRTVGFSEEYIQTQLTIKEGIIIPVTREAIFFDRTGMVTEQAGKVGELLGLSLEKEAIATLIGSPVANMGVPFVEKRQFDSAPVTLDPYQSVDGTNNTYGQQVTQYPNRPYPFYNDVPANPFVDYTSVRTCEQYFARTQDPNTGEPIIIKDAKIIMCQTRWSDYMQVMQAPNIYKISQGGLDTSGGLLTLSPGVQKQMITAEPVFSRQLDWQMQAQLGVTQAEAEQIWFYGDPGNAISYGENWPITTVQAPKDSEAEFGQDIILRWKASRRGRFRWDEPRRMLRVNLDQYKSGY